MQAAVLRLVCVSVALSVLCSLFVCPLLCGDAAAVGAFTSLDLFRLGALGTRHCVIDGAAA